MKNPESNTLVEQFQRATNGVCTLWHRLWFTSVVSRNAAQDPRETIPRKKPTIKFTIYSDWFLLTRVKLSQWSKVQYLSRSQHTILGKVRDLASSISNCSGPKEFSSSRIDCSIAWSLASATAFFFLTLIWPCAVHPVRASAHDEIRVVSLRFLFLP